MAVSNLYNSQIWVLDQKVFSFLIATEMAYLWSVKGRTRPDCFDSEGIRQELNAIRIT
jgi:hypothetical protein